MVGSFPSLPAGRQSHTRAAGLVASGAVTHGADRTIDRRLHVDSPSHGYRATLFGLGQGKAECAALGGIRDGSGAGTRQSGRSEQEKGKKGQGAAARAVGRAGSRAHVERKCAEASDAVVTSRLGLLNRCQELLEPQSAKGDDAGAWRKCARKAESRVPHLGGKEAVGTRDRGARAMRRWVSAVSRVRRHCLPCVVCGGRCVSLTRDVCESAACRGPRSSRRVNGKLMSKE